MSTATVTFHELPPVSSWAAETIGLLPGLVGPNGQYNHGATEPFGSQFSCLDSGRRLSNGATWTTEFADDMVDSSSHSSLSGLWQSEPDSVAVTSSPTYQLVPRTTQVPCEARAKKRPNTSVRMNTTAASNSTGATGGPEELCLVCADKASGYHYNALTCEGCKGFFRRSITKQARYICKYGGNCDIDMYMRRKCQACRLGKCYRIGMRPELVIPEEQCRMKRESKMRMRPTSPKPSSSPTQQHSVTSTAASTSPHPSASTTAGLSAEQKELVHRLVHYQEQFEMPSGEDLNRLSTFHANAHGGTDVYNDFQHFAELTILYVHLISDFTHCLPGFSTLCSEDQQILLKGSCVEVLILKTARQFDAKTDSVILGNQTTNWHYNRDAYKRAGFGSAAHAIFEFARSLAKLKVDNAEYALLTAVTVFSDRPGLLEPKKVEDIQEVYTTTLQAYIDVHRPKNRAVFARLLMKLTDLRSLGSEHADALFALRPTGEPEHGQALASQLTSQPPPVQFWQQHTSAPYDHPFRSLDSPHQSLDCGNEAMGVSCDAQTAVCYRTPSVRVKVEPLHSYTMLGPMAVGNDDYRINHFVGGPYAGNEYKMDLRPAMM